jgi:hypothetical protein
VDVINERAFISKLDADDGDYWRADFLICCGWLCISSAQKNSLMCS